MNIKTSSKKNKTALRWLRSRSRTASPWILLSIVLGISNGILTVGQASLLSRIAHMVFMEEAQREQLTHLFIYLLIIIVIKSGLSWYREISGFKAGAMVRRQVRKDLLYHIVNIGPVGISHLSTGSIVSSALDQVEALQNFVARYLPQMALAALLPFVILTFIFPISWAVGAVLIMTAPLIPLFMILVGMGAENISQKHFQALARMSAHFLDVLRGLPTLKQFGRSKNQASKIQKTSQAYRKHTMAVLRVAFLSSAVLEFFTAISIALVAVYLGMYYLGYIEFGTFGRPLKFESGFFILLLAPDFFLPLRELGAHYHSRADAVGAAEEILKIFNQTTMAVPESTATIPAPIPHKIHFQNVSVQYDKTRHQALHQIEVVITKGERIAVVGESGAGKSTLIHLLLGFIVPTKGRILVNDVPLTQLNINSWRHHCAWVGQHAMLFTGTLRENITIAKPNATDKQVEQAAKRSGVLEFANRWEKGLNTNIGELGLGLSMGQAQRVALARAFVKDPSVLLLDEPTANLDKTTEVQILKDLDKWCNDRTFIIATHRPAVLTLVDRIIVLKEGKPVTQGDYETLKNEHGKLLPQIESTWT